MSNTTETPRESGGGNRRRRSRGGQKRKNNNNQTDGENREPRERRENRGSSGDNRRQGGQGGQGGQGNQSGKPRRRPMPKPAELTWWQKLLKAIGLYKEPVKPARKPRPISDEPKSAPKSNTRVARTAKSESTDAPEAPRGERPPRKPRERSERNKRSERGERGEQDERTSRSGRGERTGRSENRSGGDPDSVESARVYVGNLSYEATEQDVKELFKGIGSVRNVEIVYDRKTHRSKGFGFVEMIHVDEARRAVEVLHDQFFLGREMVVSGAKKKGQDEREDQDDVRAENPKPVELAPLPPAAAVEPDPTEKAPEAVAEEQPTADIASTDIVTPVIVPDAEQIEAPTTEESAEEPEKAERQPEA